jgi:hypothetical protein
MSYLYFIKINAVRREGVGRFTGLPLGQVGVGREAICLSSFPLLLRLAFVFPDTSVGTTVFVDCVSCEDVAC